MEANQDPQAACGNCGVEERRLLHHVRHLGEFLRLCTSCVLRLHPQSFCPTCFHVYPPSPTPQNDTVLTCTKCHSNTRSYCISSPSTESPSSNSYVCSLCSTHPPDTPLFRLKSGEEYGLDGYVRVMDSESATKLLAVAKITCNSMNMATVDAWAEADKRAREAAFTRQMANQGLTYLAYMAEEYKMMRQENETGSVVVSNDGAAVDRNGISMMGSGNESESALVEEVSRNNSDGDGDAAMSVDQKDSVNDHEMVMVVDDVKNDDDDGQRKECVHGDGKSS